MVFKISGMQSAVKFTYLVSKEAVNVKCFMENMFSEKFFEKLYKTMKEFIISNAAELFYLKINPFTSISKTLLHFK